MTDNLIEFPKGGTFDYLPEVRSISYLGGKVKFHQNPKGSNCIIDIVEPSGERKCRIVGIDGSVLTSDEGAPFFLYLVDSENSGLFHQSENPMAIVADLLGFSIYESPEFENWMGVSSDDLKAMTPIFHADASKRQNIDLFFSQPQTTARTSSSAPTSSTASDSESEEHIPALFRVNCPKDAPVDFDWKAPPVSLPEPKEIASKETSGQTVPPVVKVGGYNMPPNFRYSAEKTRYENLLDFFNGVDVVALLRISEYEISALKKQIKDYCSGALLRLPVPSSRAPVSVFKDSEGKWLEAFLERNYLIMVEGFDYLYEVMKRSPAMIKLAVNVTEKGTGEHFSKVVAMHLIYDICKIYYCLGGSYRRKEDLWADLTQTPFFSGKLFQN